MSIRLPTYKAWHKTEKVMCEVSLINSRGAFLLGLSPEKDQIVDRMVIKAPKDGRFCDMKEIELLESTGLLDKKNNQVFEGDLIKLESGNIRKVVYRQFGFWLDGINEKSNFPICFFREGGITEFEIIGNIFENTEL